jgi:Flp pilus assembly protein TadG
VNKLIRNCVGSSIVEFTLVFPMFMLIALGTVDAGLMLSDWALASKAAYDGAHKAILSDPVASGINNLTYVPTLLGQPCFDSNGNNVNCPSVQVTCTPSATVGNGTCTAGYTYSDTPVANVIFPAMQARFPQLRRQNVTINYQTNNLGFVGRPDGLPMDVTVSINGMTHQFYFISGLMNFFRGTFPSVSNIPPFATTLQSEDMATN